MAVPADAADLVEIRNFLGVTDTVAYPDDQLSEHVAAAETRIKNDGIGASNEDYDLMRKYCTGAVIKAAGFTDGDMSGIGGGAGKIVEEREADVMAKYAGSVGGGGATDGSELTKNAVGGSYEIEYLRLVNNAHAVADDLSHLIQ
jgi:hypothetical protein